MSGLQVLVVPLKMEQGCGRGEGEGATVEGCVGVCKAVQCNAGRCPCAGGRCLGGAPPCGAVQGCCGAVTGGVVSTVSHLLFFNLA